MRIACIGDIHDSLERLRRVVGWLETVPLDAVLLVGDFTHPGFNFRFGRGETSAVQRALNVTSRLSAPSYFVPGNHDDPVCTLVGNIDGRVVSIGGLRVAGIGGAGPAKMGFPYEWSDEEVLARPFPDCDILLSHAPPARTRIDIEGDGDHVGSEAIRSWASRISGALVCGHIHESPGVDRIGDCLCYNAGALGEPAGRAQAGILEFTPDRGEVSVTHHDLEAGSTWTERHQFAGAES